MTEQPLQFDDLSPLLAALCDGTLDGQGFAQLEQRLVADPAARQWYLAYMDLHGELCWDHRASECREADVGWDACRGLGTSVLSETPDAPCPVHISEFGIQLSDSPLPPIVIEALPSPLSPFFSSFVGSALFSYLIAALLMGVGLLVFWAWKLPDRKEVAVQSVPGASPLVPPPKTPFVARITGMVDCQWEHALHPSSPVRLGDRFALASGLTEITYDTGAKVILQGPCTYEVESSTGGYLAIGKLTAKVEKNADLPSASGRGVGGEGVADADSPLSTLHSPLFAIRTPTATVTDLGTEFGVEVDEQGGTLSHVYRGAVEIETVGGSDKTGDGRVLRENESVRIERRNGVSSVVEVALMGPDRFVRELPKPTVTSLDLVDVVAGGHGFSGRRNRGISPLTGHVSESLPPPTSIDTDLVMVSDGQYHRVPELPLIDGVFVPDGRKGAVQVDSAGHLFEGFPQTAHKSGIDVWAGGIVPHIPPMKDLSVISMVVDGVDYSSPGHGVLFLHANKGITFDLDAIRQANKGYRLVRFRSVAANLEIASAHGGQRVADLWVLVDGKSRFQRRQVSSIHGGFAVLIPLADRDRFLTLAATDGGDDIAVDWTMFGDPVLDMVSTDRGRSASQEPSPGTEGR